MKKRQTHLLGAGMAFLLGCAAAPEVLEPLPGEPPGDVDFSGNWLLHSDSDNERQRIDEAISKAAGPGVSIDQMVRSGGYSGSRPRRHRRGSQGDLVYVFLETGESLKITQTSEGMFLSFDRSVVEEYRFGENRTINVGAIVAQRVSGWIGTEYVVKSLDKNGMKLIEKLWLSDDGNTLHREFTFRGKDDESVVATQIYDRAEK